MLLIIDNAGIVLHRISGKRAMLQQLAKVFHAHGYSAELQD